MKTNKRMAALLAMMGAVTLLAGCGRRDNGTPVNGAGVASTWNGVGVFPGFNGQPGQVGQGCATLVAGQPATLGFTNQINSAMAGSGGGTQSAQMVAPNIGVVAVMQVQVSSQQTQFGFGGPATLTGVIQISPAGATALLQEASLSQGGGWGGGWGGQFQTAQVCIQNMQSLTLNPLRGGIYLSGLPMPRSGMPHLYF